MREFPAEVERPVEPETSGAAQAPDLLAAAPSQGAFLVLVFDPVTDESDAYGPLGEWDAVMEAHYRRDEFDAEGLDEVVVAVVPLHRPRPARGRDGR